MKFFLDMNGEKVVFKFDLSSDFKSIKVWVLLIECDVIRSKGM